MAKAADLAYFETDELVERLSESRRELFNLRFQLATGQLDNPARLGQVRKEAARVLTVLRAREIAEAEGTYHEPTAAEREEAHAHVAAADAEDAARAEAQRHQHDHDEEGAGLPVADVEGEADDDGFEGELELDDEDEDEDEDETEEQA